MAYEHDLYTIRALLYLLICIYIYVIESHAEFKQSYIYNIWVRSSAKPNGPEQGE